MKTGAEVVIEKMVKEFNQSAIQISGISFATKVLIEKDNEGLLVLRGRPEVILAMITHSSLTR